MSNSVTGPDRRPATELNRRAGSGGRRPDGGEEFGSALSAEMDRAPAKTDDETQRNRVSQDRYARNQAEQYRNAQTQAARDRAATAPDRTVVQDRNAAQNRAALDRAAAHHRTVQQRNMTRLKTPT
ncbi:hypothetical protein AB0M20_36220, partial [Actinoplanes sp. NPDC051633]|uniref:hypothetical protein n=1 Tax=Actinoplanes sp. NPDC051633 TaxID=3155670 RepID=UPI003431F3D9